MANQSESPTVLIAEVGAHNGHLLKDCLREFGWQYTCINGGTEAIEAGSINNYDLIVSDMELPTDDCISWLRSLKSRNPHQAVIVVSNSCAVDDALQLFRAGATDVLFKPLNRSIFEQVAKRVVGAVQEEVAERRHDKFLVLEKRVYQARSKDLADSSFKLDILKRLRAAGRIDAACCYQISLAFQEAFANSLEHGNLELESIWKEEINENGEDRYSALRRQRLHESPYSERLITMSVEFDGRALTIEISDQGKGFKREKKTPDARQDLNVHGRGIPIMHGVLDSVEFEDGGRKIRLVKVLGQASDC